MPYLALFNGDTEIQGRGYARVHVERGNGEFDVSFPIAAADWGTITSIALFNDEGDLLGKSYWEKPQVASYGTVFSLKGGHEDLFVEGKTAWERLLEDPLETEK